MTDVTLADERRCLLIVWRANAIGICPDFEDAYGDLRPVAERLAVRDRPGGRLLYPTSEGPDSDIESGYCLTQLGEQIAEALFDWSDPLPEEHLDV